MTTIRTLKNSIFPLLLGFLLCGCKSPSAGTYSEFKAAPDRYTSFKVGQEYEIQEDMFLLQYDYLIIPLVKPGIQLMPTSNVKESDLPKEFSLMGHIRKGDRVRICGYENEGGWVPCKGDWYMVNPMVLVLDGELKGHKVGISFLCADNTEKVPFRTGKIYYAKPDAKFIKKRA